METEKKKVLIADDEPYVIRVVKLKLTNAGYEVITASNGIDALEKIKAIRPDVVISDVNMPRLGGKELCLQTIPLKKEKEFLTIVITSSLEEADREWAHSLENTIFVEKPFSPKELVKIIGQYFCSEFKNQNSGVRSQWLEKN
jgi:CheY-like chemotaxis protein